MRRIVFLLVLFIFGVLAAAAQTSNAPSVLIEAAGIVEYSGTATNWRPATVGLALKPGDRVRTREQSRAAVQLSDRSVVRLNERTTLEILAPRREEKRRFGLPRGMIYFFNREKPADVEFDTPLAAGAIRGTEFLLAVAESDASLQLALMDGLVALNTLDGEVTLERGQELDWKPGQPPRKAALVNASALIQWALYYPAIINPEELQLDASERTGLSAVLKHYREGDLLAALAAWPATPTEGSTGSRSLRAQLELAVGRVAEAERLLTDVPDDFGPKLALTELIAVVRGKETMPQSAARRSASELLASTYALQSCTDLPGALAAAKAAVALAPDFGFAHARLAELEFAFGNRRAALAELKPALELSPRLPPAHALQGFALLDQGLFHAALNAFDQARERDAAFGPAWLGRGLCLLRKRQFTEARAAVQAAAALEPRRALFRSYLGKAAGELGDTTSAQKEFRLAKELDPEDPTAWLYSALELWQENRLNEAIRDLEKSADRNDNRAVFRSRLLLDGDRSVRSANLAALYEDAGFPEVSRHAAARSVAESYANFSGHLFLANSHAALEDVNRFDLRMETARQSELLVANLLAPPGAGNLSQSLSQQEHLRFFDARPVGVSSLTEYGSDGDWRQSSTMFGTAGGLSYAFDAAYENLNGQNPDGAAERRQFALTLQQRVTADDEFYFQAGLYDSEAGDVADYYDPAYSKLGFNVVEKQLPTLYAGWHHSWSPGSHTLLLGARLTDRLSLHDPMPDIPYLVYSGGAMVDIQGPARPFRPSGYTLPLVQDSTSEFTLHSVELQQVFESPRHSLVLGGRGQWGDVNTSGTLDVPSIPLVTYYRNQNGEGHIERENLYGYYSWRPYDWLRLAGGVSYDHLTFPENLDLPPISSRETSRELVSPKAGLLLTPWRRGALRASYTKSLGGLYFDNSVRLEPTQVGGFNQAFRSLIPASVAGLVPGTEFETAGVGFDQSWPGGTWLGAEAEWLRSDGSRSVGVLTNSTFLVQFPDAGGSTRQTLDFQERSVSAYAAQLLGDNLSVVARYRISEAKLSQRFPDVVDTASNLPSFEQDNTATLQQLSLAGSFHHPSGFFARWESNWYHQNNSGYVLALPSDAFWQHDIFAGYRLPRHHAEFRVGLLNLLDADYRLNPLNLHSTLPRGRTFVASLRLNF